jgi:hypothetical protein
MRPMNSGVAPLARYSASTRSTRPGGATTLWRSDHRRSKISASAMTEAKINGPDRPARLLEQ